MLATSPPVDTVLEKVSFLISNIHRVHKLTLAVSLGALTILILAKLFKARLVMRKGFKWLAYVPEVLAVVIASTGSILLPWLSCAADLVALQFSLPFSAGTSKA